MALNVDTLPELDQSVRMGKMGSRTTSRAPSRSMSRNYDRSARPSISSVRSTNTSLLGVGHNILNPHGGSTARLLMMKTSQKSSPRISINSLGLMKSPRISTVTDEDDDFINFYDENADVSKKCRKSNHLECSHLIHLFSQRPSIL